MELLRDLGTAYQHLAQYNCRKAIECLEALPPQHYNTGWVLSLMGKAYFELSDFQTSVRYVMLCMLGGNGNLWNFFCTHLYGSYDLLSDWIGFFFYTLLR